MDCAPTAAIVGRTVAGPGLVLRDYATLACRRRVGADRRERLLRRAGDRAHRRQHAPGDRSATTSRSGASRWCTRARSRIASSSAMPRSSWTMRMSGAGALITAGSLVPPRKRLAGGWIYEGNPATPVREIGAEELAAAAARSGAECVGAGHGDRPAAARHGGLRGSPARPTPRRATLAGARRASAQAYIAPTAVLAGDVTVADDASVYFGCAVVAGDGRIVIGPRTNVQDNSLLVTDAARGPLARRRRRHDRAQRPAWARPRSGTTR